MSYTEIYFVILQKGNAMFYISLTMFSYFRGQKHKNHHHHLCTVLMSASCQVDVKPQKTLLPTRSPTFSSRPR